MDFESDIITYEELLNVFWNSHTPVYEASSRQYMSIIFYHNEQQKRIAEETKLGYEKMKNLKIYTEIIPFTKFYLAESYHQKYYLQLARELMKEFGDNYTNFIDFVNSTSAAQVNGYIKGYGTITRLMNEVSDLGLSEKGQERLKQIVEGYGR